MPLLDVHGAQIAYDVYDDAESPYPLVFIHAGIATRFMWTPQIETFRHNWRVVVYDTRGYGESFSEGVTFSNRDDLLALLDHLSIRQAVLIGCSRGGQIATDFTLEHPDRVRALVSVCGGLGGMDGEIPQAEQDWFAELDALYERGEYDELVEREIKTWVVGLTRDASAVDPELIAEFRRMGQSNLRHVTKPQPTAIPLDPPAAGRLSEIQVPTLVVIGAHDETGSKLAADALTIGIAGAKRVDFSDSAHVPSAEHPARFNKALKAFLDDL